MSIYRTGTICAEVLRIKLRQLLEQEGQPCSYCIAVFMIEARGEGMTLEDAESYRRHLLRDHCLEPFAIQQ